MSARPMCALCCCSADHPCIDIGTRRPCHWIEWDGPRVCSQCAELVRGIRRCDREIAEIEARTDPAPAYLTTLGAEDWAAERGIILDLVVEKCLRAHEAGLMADMVALLEG